MIELLDKKYQLLMEMLLLTEAQTSAINLPSLDILQKLVEEKQQKIDAIDKLDEEFRVYFERLKMTTKVKKLENMDTSAFPGAKQLKDKTGEILALVSRISEVEKQNSAKSNELLTQLGSQIKKINQGKKINNAYNPAPTNTASFFLDKKK